MKTCPACSREVPPHAVECPGCGIIFSRFRGRRPPPPPPVPPPPEAVPRPSAPRAQVRRPGSRLGLALVLGLVGGLAVAGAYWYLRIYPRLRTIDDPYYGVEPGRARRLTARVDTVSDFDRAIDLPVGPVGIVWNGKEFLIGNRKKPWGFLRLTPTDSSAEGQSFTARQVPVIEPVYRQEVSFATLTWNGTHYVGYTDGSWFQSPHAKVFTLHDSETLQVVRRIEAPELLGGLAWDGSGYWAATRRNTRDSGEAAYLYRLDDRFEVVSRLEPPAVGCQGLAWDGFHLWFVDVFSDRLYLLDVAASRPEVIQSYPTHLGYLSGVGFDGEDVWIVEYGEDRLYRLNPRFPRAWLARHRDPSAGAPRLGDIATRRPAGARPAAGRLDAAAVEALKRQLRSDDWTERMSAEMELRRNAVPIDYARDKSLGTPSRPAAESEILDWAVELDEGRLYGSWHIFFGPEFFSPNPAARSGPVSLPTFAKYTLTVEGGSLRQPVEREFQAESGDNVKRRVELASGLGPGKYSVSLFVHVQFVDRTGQGRIWNQSGATLEVER